MTYPGKLIAQLNPDTNLILMDAASFYEHHHKIQLIPFEKTDYFTQLDLILSQEETLKKEQLAKRMHTAFTLRLGIFTQEGKMIGWHKGEQVNAEEYYMGASALLPDYQKRGFYSLMLPHILTLCKNEGFQVISSKHSMTHNAIIIPKLKQGFVMVGTEVNDKHGALVRLAYYTNEERRRMVESRTGHTIPNPTWQELRSKAK